MTPLAVPNSIGIGVQPRQSAVIIGIWPKPIDVANACSVKAAEPCLSTAYSQDSPLSARLLDQHLSDFPDLAYLLFQARIGVKSFWVQWRTIEVGDEATQLRDELEVMRLHLHEPFGVGRIVEPRFQRWLYGHDLTTSRLLIIVLNGFGLASASASVSLLAWLSATGLSTRVNAATARSEARVVAMQVFVDVPDAIRQLYFWVA